MYHFAFDCLIEHFLLEIIMKWSQLLKLALQVLNMSQIWWRIQRLFPIWRDRRKVIIVFEHAVMDFIEQLIYIFDV